MEDNTEFDFELFINDGMPLPPPCSIPKEYNQAGFLNELAFHEASHFVFDILGKRLSLGFSPIEAIKISPTDPKGNYVRGFHSPFPETDAMSGINRKKWYFENESQKHNRLFTKALSLIAGYTSYQIFVEDTPHFINPKIEEGGNSFPNYHRIDCLPDPPPSDFQLLSEMLGWIGQNSTKKVLEIQNVVKKIMHHPSVANAIRFVKNYLLKNIGREISGTELNYLKRGVERQIQKISLEKYLDLI